MARREFVLVGMQHSLGMVPKILKECKAVFKKGDKIAIELPQARVDYYRLLDSLIAAGSASPSDLKAVKNLIPEFRKDCLQALSSMKTPYWQKEKRRLKKCMAKDTGWILLKGLGELGFKLVGLDSYLANKILDKPFSKKNTEKEFSRNFLLFVLRDKLFSKKIIRDKKLAGGVFGSAHIQPIKAQLEQNGIKVTVKKVISLSGKILRVPSAHMLRKIAYTRAKKRILQRIAGKAAQRNTQRKP